MCFFVAEKYHESISLKQRLGGKMSTKDSNGNELLEGDSVQVIKDLKVKGSSSTLKRGTKFKNIHLTDNEEEVECREGKSTLVLKTCFLKKL
jgi:protein PhnA